MLFGDANRFVKDLYVMLRLKAACVDFVSASQKNLPVFRPYAEFVAWLDRWQSITGYECLELVYEWGSRQEFAEAPITRVKRVLQ